jgi:peroxiredoxin
MRRREQWAWVGAITLVLVAGAITAAHALRDQLFPVTLGSQAPVFEANTIDGTSLRRTLADYRGKVVLLNIWATWCTPCIVEMPTIEALHREFKDTDLRVVAVSIDQAQTEHAIRDFVKELGLTFEVLHDPEGAITRVYQVMGYPETFVIGRDGVIRKIVIGATDWNSEGNRALIRQLLAEQS